MDDRHSLSLQEEARQTTRRSRAHWSAESKLRKNPVAFTSSGATDPFQNDERKPKSNDAMETGINENKSSYPSPDTTHITPVAQSCASTSLQASCSRSPNISYSEISKLTGKTETGEALPTASLQSPAKERRCSQASSCCSEDEIILFTGRSKDRERPQPTRRPGNEVTDENKALVETTTRDPTQPLLEHGPPSSPLMPSNDSDDGNGITSDYLTNLLASGEQLTAETFHFRDLGGSEDEICFSESDAISGSISLDSDWDGPVVSWSTRRKKKQVGKYLHSGIQSRKNVRKQHKRHDLFSRYPTGMSMDQVIEELQEFLMSAEEQLSFPPLSKYFRKLLHEMASRLRLKSKSIGKGDTRRPVLYRTKATPMFDTDSFEAATSKITRRVGGTRSKPGSKRPRASGGGVSGYRDGEVVGSELPELSAENRGRAMLEKMGWSTGMALGSVENKGILQPVSQVIKRSKAGLGKE